MGKKKGTFLPLLKVKKGKDWGSKEKDRPVREANSADKENLGVSNGQRGRKAQSARRGARVY